MMFAKHPRMAKEFASATPKGKKLPEKVAPSVDDQVKVMRRMGKPTGAALPGGEDQESRKKKKVLSASTPGDDNE